MAGGALSFREDPFRLTPDRRYIFETDGFRRAFAMLLAGVRARRGAMLLTGPSGTGKTTLLQGLLGKLQQDGAVVFWRFHPDIPGYDLIGSCLAELEIPDAPVDPTARAEALAEAVKARARSQPAVLIVDEAGQFADVQLAEIIALPATTGGAVQVVLAGLPAIIERLDSDGLLALKDAVALRAEIGPLGSSELGAYIAHRCRVAGQADPLAFEPPAIGRVFDHTGGTPRLVNRLCATALFFAPAGARQISAAVVDEAARACAGEPAAEPHPPETPAPTAATVPAATNTPAATTAPEAPAQAPEIPKPQEAQSQVHRTLAEAERAWISGAAMKALPPTAAAPGSIAAPASAELPPTEVPAPPMDLTMETAVIHDDASNPAPTKEAASVRRRSPALRIAASLVVIAGSAAALMAVLWPTKIGHDYLAQSTPAKAVARLLVANVPALTPAPEPARVVAEAAVPPDTQVVANTGPTEAQPDSVAQAEPVIAKVEPASEPTQAASATPATEMPSPSAVPEPAPVAAVASQPEPTPPAASEPPAQIASPAPEPAASEPAAVAAALSAIAPANGPTDQTETEMSVAAPAEVKAAPAAVAIASTEPKIETPAPVMKVPEAPAVAVAAPPPPSAPRMTQASLPAADSAELRQLMARGDEMLKLGDPAAARLFYERAAVRGLARAYTAVGRTYDPLALQRLNIRGGGANGDQALDWYRRGAEAGDGDAAKAASDLSAWLARPR